MEIEVKFRVDFWKAKRAIESIGAEFVREEVQEDLYLSIPLPQLLRIRRIRNLNRSFLTYKRIEDPGRNEEFDEVEVEVSDFEKTLEIMKCLGYEEDIWVRKRRLVYRLGEVTFELNDVEGLGGFLDVEVISDDVKDAKRMIWEVARELGLTERDVEPRLYRELLREANRGSKT